MSEFIERAGIAVENVSYYAHPGPAHCTEQEFLVARHMGRDRTAAEVEQVIRIRTGETGREAL